LTPCDFCACARTIAAVKRICISVLIGVLLGASPAFAEQSKTSTLSDVASLIEALTDRDAAVRQQASQKLLDMGSVARPALLKAVRSDDPERRSRAAGVLLKLPWYTAGDSKSVRNLLT